MGNMEIRLLQTTFIIVYSFTNGSDFVQSKARNRCETSSDRKTR